MNGEGERSGGMNRTGQRARRDAAGTATRWTKVGVGTALVGGAVLFLGLVFWPHHAAPRRAAILSLALSPPPTPFEASFARAQHWYFLAQVIAKQQLEALEEWDGDALRGSAPEIYRRSVMARTRETGLAEAAAREAAGRARTNEESYRAIRLLVHIEGDLGHHKAELQQAKKLVALRPHYPEALLLERAAEGNGQRGIITADRRRRGATTAAPPPAGPSP